MVVILQKGVVMQKWEGLKAVVTNKVHLHEQYTILLEINYICAVILIRITIVLS